LSKLPVLEIFGPTIQGEGMVVGRKTMFVRTAGCDYRCSWCDSAFTWDGSAKDEIRKLSAQGSKWQDWMVDIDDLTISPKPPSSKMKTDFTKLDAIIDELRSQNRVEKHTSLKVVVFDDEDFEYAVGVHERYPDVPFFLQVGNDDTSTTDDDNLTRDLLNKYEWLIDKTMEDARMNNVRVLPQLHTFVWGNSRGV